MKFRAYLREMSFEKKDIPRTFRVVFDVNEYDKAKTLNIIKQLSNMRLDGLTGISDKHDIGFHWLGVARDAMLVMKGSEVIKLNKVSRFLYGNPNYFLSSNMKMIRRLFQKSSQEGDDSNVLHNIMEYVFKGLNVNSMGDAPHQSYAHVAYKKSTKISSVKDLVRWMRKAGDILKADQEGSDWPNRRLLSLIEELREMSDKQIETGIYKGFELMGKTYKSEGEWVIKDDHLKIPKGSTIYILAPKKAAKDVLRLKEKDPTSYNIQRKMGHHKFMEKFDMITSEFKKKGINKKYRVKFIDGSEWARIQSQHLAKG